MRNCCGTQISYADSSHVTWKIENKSALTYPGFQRFLASPPVPRRPWFRSQLSESEKPLEPRVAITRQPGATHFSSVIADQKLSCAKPCPPFCFWYKFFSRGGPLEARLHMRFWCDFAYKTCPSTCCASELSSRLTAPTRAHRLNPSKTQQPSFIAFFPFFFFLAASDGHRRKFSSPAILNAQRNILTNANLSKPEEYVIPANVLPSKNDAAAKPGRAACKQPINNVADSGGAGSDGYSLVSVPGRSPAPRDDGYSFVSMPQRDPPKRDDGYSFVAMPQRETTPPRDDGYSLVAVPGRSPAPRDDGYSFVAMPHRGPAKQSQSPPGSVVSPVPAEKPAVLSKTPASKPSVTAEGQYSLVGPLGGNDRVDVVPRKSQDPPGAYCLVGIPMNEGAAASANLGRSDAVSSNPGPYDLVGAPGLQGRQPDVPAQQDPTYSTVQPSNNVAFTGKNVSLEFRCYENRQSV